MRELLLIASAAAVVLAGFPFMKRADDFIARWARREDGESAPASAPDAAPQTRQKAPSPRRLTGVRVRRRIAPKASHPV
ncbi:MAG: hypothetical protein ACI4WX_10430 [Aristaeellaceae bacterium]